MMSVFLTIVGIVNLGIYFVVRFSFEVSVLKIKFNINKVI